MLLHSGDGYTLDPVGDLARTRGPGLIHKYARRVLLIATGSCAVHCRYCFRRHFPYADELAAREGWRAAVAEIAADRSIVEVILSGGDPLSLSTAKLAELTEALAAVHRAGVVHRDLKPGNVLIMFSDDDQPIVKLVDFGVSRLHDPGLDTPNGQAQAAREVASVALALRGGEAASAPTLDGRETIDLSALYSDVVKERPSRRNQSIGKPSVQGLRGSMWI